MVSADQGTRSLLMADMLERACRRVAARDGRNPDRWRDYISAEQRSCVFAEIDAERNRGLFICAVLFIVAVFGPAIIAGLSHG